MWNVCVRGVEPPPAYADNDLNVARLPLRHTHMTYAEDVGIEPTQALRPSGLAVRRSHQESLSSMGGGPGSILARPPFKSHCEWVPLFSPRLHGSSRSSG